MTWNNRLRLWGGVLLVILLLIALTLLFNQRQSRVASASATVDAPTAQVGSSYGGVLTEAHVQVGDAVRVGQPLFTVVSPDIQREQEQGYKPQSNAAYDVDLATGTITFKAVIDGQVTSSDAVVGSYLTPGASLATVSATQPKSVLADFDLEPVDYARVEKGAPVTINLADNTQLRGTVADVGVANDEGRITTKVRVESPELTRPDLEHLTRAGSPVQAVMALRDDGLLAGPTHVTQEFLTKIGLR